MPRGDTQAQNHPRPGSAIRVQPITNRAAIATIKQTLKTKNLRDYCLFTLGINTAYRASELLSLSVGQVAHLQVGDLLEIKQKKTKRYRTATLNKNAVEALQLWLSAHPARDNENASLFASKVSKKALCVATVTRMVKKWCMEAGLSGHYGSHTFRKTWGYHQRVENNVPTPLLMMAFGHKTEAQTLEYLHIQDDEIRDLYLELEL